MLSSQFYKFVNFVLFPSFCTVRAAAVQGMRGFCGQDSSGPLRGRTRAGLRKNRQNLRVAADDGLFGLQSRLRFRHVHLHGRRQTGRQGKQLALKKLSIFLVRNAKTADFKNSCVPSFWELNRLDDITESIYHPSPVHFHQRTPPFHPEPSPILVPSHLDD